MNQLDYVDTDSQGIIYTLDVNTKTATITGYHTISDSDVSIKRGVMDTIGVIYKVTEITSSALTSAPILSLSLPQTLLSEFTYDLNGFPPITFVTFKDQVLNL